MGQVEDAITTTFENFEFVVETFDKTAGVAVDKIVGDFFRAKYPAKSG